MVWGRYLMYLGTWTLTVSNLGSLGENLARRLATCEADAVCPLGHTQAGAS